MKTKHIDLTIFALIMILIIGLTLLFGFGPYEPEPQFTITKEVCGKENIFLCTFNVSVFRMAEDEFRDTYGVFSSSYIEEKECKDPIIFFTELYHSIVGSYYEGFEIISKEFLRTEEVCEQVEVDEIEINLNSSYFEHIINLFLEKELSNKWFIGWLEENCECVGVIPEKSENKRIRWSNKCYKKYPFTSGEDVNYKKYNSCFGEKYFSCWDYNNTKTGFCESCSKYKCGEYMVEVLQ